MPEHPPGLLLPGESGRKVQEQEGLAERSCRENSTEPQDHPCSLLWMWTLENSEETTVYALHSSETSWEQCIETMKWHKRRKRKRLSKTGLDTKVKLGVALAKHRPKLLIKSSSCQALLCQNSMFEGEGQNDPTGTCLLQSLSRAWAGCEQGSTPVSLSLCSGVPALPHAAPQLKSCCCCCSESSPVWSIGCVNSWMTHKKAIYYQKTNTENSDSISAFPSTIISNSSRIP